jgi:hypothetical protein
MPLLSTHPGRPGAPDPRRGSVGLAARAQRRPPATHERACAPARSRGPTGTRTSRRGRPPARRCRGTIPAPPPTPSWSRARTRRAAGPTGPASGPAGVFGKAQDKRCDWHWLFANDAALHGMHRRARRGGRVERACGDPRDTRRPGGARRASTNSRTSGLGVRSASPPPPPPSTPSSVSARLASPSSSASEARSTVTSTGPAPSCEAAGHHAGGGRTRSECD